MKRFLSVLMVFAVILSCFALTVSVSAENSDNEVSGTCGYQGDNLTWKLDLDTGELVISGSGDMNNYSNPWAPWYSYRENIYAVTINNGVTSIGEYALYDCRKLTSVTIGSSVETIFNDAFSSCSSLTSINIPDSVESIGKNAFSHCYGLTSVIVGNSVSYIGDWAFSDCYKLIEIYNLSSLNIIKGSQDYGWVGCFALDIYKSIDEQSKLHTTSDGFVFYENGNTCYLVGYTGTQTDIILPTSYNGKNYEIYKYAYFKCNAWTSVTIDGGVTSIGDYAFDRCSSLTSINIPDSVTSIGDHAFNECSSLTSINIPDSVTSIGDYAFSGFNSLTSITIPDSVESIGNRAFYGYSSLTSIVVGANNTKYHSSGNCLIETEAKELILGCQNSVIPNDGSVTSIGNDAFDRCSSLTSINIPDSVTSIGDYAFNKCSSLTSINIPDSVTSIGYGTFYTCSDLKKVYINSNTLSSKLTSSTSCESLIRYADTILFGEDAPTVTDYVKNNYSYKGISYENGMEYAVYSKVDYDLITPPATDEDIEHGGNTPDQGGDTPNQGGENNAMGGNNQGNGGNNEAGNTDSSNNEISDNNGNSNNGTSSFTNSDNFSTTEKDVEKDEIVVTVQGCGSSVLGGVAFVTLATLGMGLVIKKKD